MRMAGKGRMRRREGRRAARRAGRGGRGEREGEWEDMVGISWWACLVGDLLSCSSSSGRRV